LKSFETKNEAEDLMAKLVSDGIHSELSIQPLMFNKEQYKIIVFGKDIVKAKNYI